MYIKITQEVSDGKFTVGNTYRVVSQHGVFVYATDDEGNTEAVYTYQFVVV